MSTIDLVLTICAIVLALAALPTVHRIVAGPTILDRAVAADMLVVLVVLGLALYSASTTTTWAVPSMLSLTAFAFIGTVGVARFVAREEPRGSRPRPLGAPASEPVSTQTGEHDAIHPEVPALLPGWEAEDSVWVDDEDGWADIPANSPSGAAATGEVPLSSLSPSDEHDGSDDADLPARSGGFADADLPARAGEARDVGSSDAFADADLPARAGEARDVGSSDDAGDPPAQGGAA